MHGATMKKFIILHAVCYSGSLNPTSEKSLIIHVGGAFYIYTWGFMHFEYCFFNLLLPVQYNKILFHGVHILKFLAEIPAETLNFLSHPPFLVKT